MHERDKGYIQPDNEPDHKDARISALTAEVERITNDRDAWREQHENLVACFQTEQKNLGAKIATLELRLTVSEKGRICAIEDKQGFIEDWKRLTAENERLRGALSAYPTADDPLATADLVKCATFTEESKQRRMIYVEKALFDRLLKDKERLVTARPFDEWHEDMGPVLWWHFPICEPPYVGTPLDKSFLWLDDERPYRTHWTPLPNCNEIQEQFDAARGRQG